jgi:hypothetical protein
MLVLATDIFRLQNVRNRKVWHIYREYRSVKETNSFFIWSAVGEFTPVSVTIRPPHPPPSTAKPKAKPKGGRKGLDCSQFFIHKYVYYCSLRVPTPERKLTIFRGVCVVSLHLDVTLCSVFTCWGSPRIFYLQLVKKQKKFLPQTFNLI